MKKKSVDNILKEKQVVKLSGLQFKERGRRVSNRQDFLLIGPDWGN